jgi:protein TonB
MQVLSPTYPSSEEAPGLARDPLRRVLELDTGNVRWALNVALVIAALAHVAGAAQAALLGNGTYRWARDLRAQIEDRLRTEIDLVRTPPPEPPPAPKAEEPEAKAAPRPEPAPKAAKAEPPPEPAQAGKILTQEPSPDEPVDLTGGGFVTGNADSYAGGVTANTGTSKTPVRNQNAVVGGVPGGKGEAKNVGAAPDLSKPAGLREGDTDWGDCPFPPEADADQIDFQKVAIIVTVRADGTPQSVKVLSDPGHGFGRAARDCAMRHRYSPGLDREGRPVMSSLPPINVKFTR